MEEDMVRGLAPLEGFGVIDRSIQFGLFVNSNGQHSGISGVKLPLSESEGGHKATNGRAGEGKSFAVLARQAGSFAYLAGIPTANTY